MFKIIAPYALANVAQMVRESKRQRVLFPVQAHTQAAGSISGPGGCIGECFFLSRSLSFLCLKINFFKLKKIAHYRYINHSM